jgi:glycosyltransferase involved in cell wall biosynthesis
MAAPGASVTYVLPRIMGGVVAIVENLLRFRRPDGMSYHVVLTRERGLAQPAFEDRLPADTQREMVFDPRRENMQAIFRRLARRLPPGPGVLVANDWIELAMLSEIDPGRAVIQIMHVDFEWYYELAVKHAPLVDAFVTYSRRVDDELRARLPARRETIFRLPYGVPIPPVRRSPALGPLRLLYAGRLQDDQKGVFSLPAIDAALRRMGVPVRWTVAGDGLDAGELRRRWGEPPHVAWLGQRTRDEVRLACLQHDVFVLPTRYEGMPVAMLEAMAAGVVPVVSDVASGVPEAVEADVSGFRPSPGDVEQFARAIAALHGDRDRLEAMSEAARRRVEEEFDIRERASEYQALFGRWRELWRSRARSGYDGGSRLDRRWIPNALVRSIRGVRQRLAGDAS